MVVSACRRIGVCKALLISRGVLDRYRQSIGSERRRASAFPVGPAITKAEWQPYIDAGTKVAVDIYSLDPQTIDTVVPRILGETTGKLHDQLSQNSDVLRQFVTTLGKTRQAVVTGAGLEALSRCCESPCGHACDNPPD